MRSATERFTETVVLPTPPFGAKTAITREAFGSWAPIITEGGVSDSGSSPADEAVEAAADASGVGVAAVPDRIWSAWRR
jgi:hypothetical protein